MIETVGKAEEQGINGLISSVPDGPFVSFDEQRESTYLDEVETLKYRRYGTMTNNRSKLFESIAV